LNNFLDLDQQGGRPDTRPGAGGGGAAGDFLQNQPAGGRPADRQGDRGDRQGERQGDRGDRQGNAGDRQENRQGNAGDRQDNRQDTQGNRQDDRSNRLDSRNDNRANRVENRQDYQQNRVDRRTDIQDHYHNHPGQLPHYGRGYWGANNNWRWGWHNHANNNWWAFATAGAITGWVSGGIGGGQPTYYDYGDNCYYEGDTVYYEGQAVATADEYAQQAQTIATSIPEVEPDNVEWMPLGVFALTESGDAGADPTIFLQLAISKEGIIAGTIQNTATDKSSEVEGTIDQKSQRAAWGAVGKEWPIMETGIYNLTKEDATTLLHFADGQTQQWLMVRLDEPDDAGQNN
jgi:hypothetical protein